jgi:hypothetical protein
MQRVEHRPRKRCSVALRRSSVISALLTAGIHGSPTTNRSKLKRLAWKTQLRPGFDSRGYWQDSQTEDEMNGVVAALIGIIAAGGEGVSARTGDASPVTVAVQGVCVVKPAPGGDDRLLAFRSVAGTTVALLVTDPQKGLVVFDSNSSRVKSFVDNKGKDLTKPEPGTVVDTGPESWAFQAVPPISDDRKYCCVEVSMPGIPAKQATTLTISGNLVFKTAREKTNFAAERVALRAGTKVNAGSIPLTIKRAGKSESGSDKVLEVEFQATQNLDSIASLQFFDATGRKIEATEALRSFGKFMHNASGTLDYDATLTYRLKSSAETARIVITYWADMKAVSVPFDLTVSLGL